MTRAPGSNDVGMVAWMLTLRTPEYPEGRQVVLIANDITHQVCCRFAYHGDKGNCRPAKRTQGPASKSKEQWSALSSVG